MARTIARFAEGLPQVGGLEIVFQDGQLVLAGSGTRLRPEQVVAAVAAGKASWTDAAAGAALEARFGTPAPGPVPVPSPEPAAAPGQEPLPRVVPLPDLPVDGGPSEEKPKRPRRRHHRRNRRLRKAAIAIAVVAALAAAAWFAWPYAAPTLAPLLGIGSRTATATPEPTATVTTPSVPATVTTPSVPATGAGEPTYTAVPATETTASQDATITGYLRGYDPGSPVKGVVLLYGESGNAVPVAYDAKSTFLVDGSKVTLEQFAKTYVKPSGTPGVPLAFRVRFVKDATGILGSKTASLSVDPAAVKLYLVRVQAK